MRKTLGLFALLLFLVTSVELHADDELEASSEAHCSVTCCPSHHLGPRIQSSLAPKRPHSDRLFSFENFDDPSTSIPRSVFHPPKA